MSNLKKVFFLLALGVVFLIGCDGDKTPAALQIQSEHEYALSEFIDPSDLQIATPLYPYFIITGAELNSCVGDDYIAVHVKNTGPYYFKYAMMWANTGSETFSVWPKDFNPFHWSSTDCPLGPGGSGLWPGGSAWLYIPVEHTFGTGNYYITVKMCTYIGDPPYSPDNCVTKDYNLTLETWEHVFVEIRAENVCPIGPDPLKYEVISSLFPGEVVELLGRAKEPGWLVVLNSKYNVPCFFPEDDANIPDEKAGDSKDEEFAAGEEKDTSCPQGEKYDFALGECVTKCSKYKDEKVCENAGCTWESPIGTSNYGTCKE